MLLSRRKKRKRLKKIPRKRILNAQAFNKIVDAGAIFCVFAF